MPEEPFFTVMFQDAGAPLSLDLLEGPVAETLGISLLDARVIVRNANGVFAYNIRETRALELAQKLTEFGYPAFAVDSACIMRLYRPRSVRTAAFANSKIELKTGFGAVDSVRLASEDIVFMSCGIVATAGFRDYFANSDVKKLFSKFSIEDLPEEDGTRDQARKSISRRAADRGRETISLNELIAKRKVEALELDKLCREQTLGLLDILASDGTLHRISRHDFEYSCLDSAQAVNSMQNFKLLVQTIVMFAPDAEMPDYTRNFEADKPLGTVVFNDTEAFEKYNTWKYYMSGIVS